jgi:hypothetical protein
MPGVGMSDDDGDDACVGCCLQLGHCCTPRKHWCWVAEEAVASSQVYGTARAGLPGVHGVALQQLDLARTNPHDPPHPSQCHAIHKRAVPSTRPATPAPSARSAAPTTAWSMSSARYPVVGAGWEVCVCADVSRSMVVHPSWHVTPPNRCLCAIVL